MQRKSKKPNVFVITVLFLCVAAVGIWIWPTSNDQHPGDIVPMESKAQDTTSPLPIQTDKAKLYSMAVLSEADKRDLVKKLVAISPIYNADGQPQGPADNEAAAETAKQVVDETAFAFDYGKTRYIVAADYSGGAHCCFGWYVFYRDGGDLKQATPNQSIATMGNIPPAGEQNLVEKNGKLYMALDDDRFAYVCGSFASSPMVSRYFLVNGNELILANADFKEEFIKDAQTASAKISGTDIAESRCTYLVEETASYLLAGQNGLVESGFAGWHKKAAPVSFSGMDGSTQTTAAGILQGIKDYLNQRDFGI